MTKAQSAQRPTLRQLPKEIMKRDGTMVEFSAEPIVTAIRKAMKAADEGSPDSDAKIVAHSVVKEVAELHKQNPSWTISVEDIQDIVENELILMSFPKTAKAYILYRQKRAEMRQHRGVVPENIRDMVALGKEHFRNQLAEYAYYSFYSKWMPENGRRETWVETVDRFMDFMRENLGKKLQEGEYKEIREYIFDMRAMPSMRLLWSSGPAARNTNVAAYNCAYVAPKCWQDFGEIMYISMCGTGLGFSVERRNVEMLPIIKKQTGKKLPTYVVGDSKEGWADAFVSGLKAWSEGMDIDYDFSKVRPQGARLKTMGGRASGPEPLRNLIEFTREKMFIRQGRHLTTLDVHDVICKIGEIVVAGGVRRSAMISLSELDDVEMRSAKNGQFYLSHPQRSMANNSAVYEEKPTMAQFIDEWTNLIRSGSGERGLFNRGGLKIQMPKRRFEMQSEEQLEHIGMNPCVTKDTWVQTDGGPREVKDLIDRPFRAIVDGRPYASPTGFFATGMKPVFMVQTSRGFTFRATADHPVLVNTYRTSKTRRDEWRDVGKLKTGDEIVLNNHHDLSWEGEGSENEGWLLGSLLGDGNIEKNQKANLDFWGEHRVAMMQYAQKLVHDTVGGRSDLRGHVAKTGYARVGTMKLGHLASASYEMRYGNKVVTGDVERASSSFYVGFLRGWFDADGSIQGSQEKGVSVRLASNSLPNLEAAQRMLARLGIIGTLYKNRRPTMMRSLPDGRGGMRLYECGANHELVISGANLSGFAERIGFFDPSKKEKLANIMKRYDRKLNRESFVTRVLEVVPVGVEEVYDCQVETVHAFDANGLYAHNCGEIVLRSKEFCNLSEVVARAEDTEKTLLDKTRVATILGTYQATLTKFPYLSAEWKRNCQEEALLGVSITGQWDSPAVRDPKTLKKMRELAIEVNKKYAKRFGINQSLSITCVKPSGNSSQTYHSSSGCHPRHAPYYIRRVRVESHNPLFAMVRDMGVPHNPEVGQNKENARTYVLEFPIKSPEGAVCKDDLSALDQLEYWKMVKENFTEHNPSVTISVGEEEWLEVGSWVYKNWDIVGGLSFLPRADHIYKLAPYEAITKERYEELMKAFPKDIDFSKLALYEYEDKTHGAKEIACVAGVCETDFVQTLPSATASGK